METLTLLHTPFFASLENRDDSRIRNDYEDIRSLIVAFSMDNDCWRTVHTGLAILVTEVSFLIDEGLPEELARYGRRILTLAKCMIAQVELTASRFLSDTVSEPTENKETVTEEKDETAETTPLTLSANYSDLAEIINVIITMKMANGGRVKNTAIINAVHRLFGLECGVDRYYNTRNAIRNRCPREGTSLTYFLDAAKESVNNELSAR